MSMLILTGGRFGRAVAEILAREREVTVFDLAALPEDLQQQIERHDHVAVATWRPYLQACKSIDEACHVAGKPWSVVEIIGSALVCGPSIVPGHGAGCYHCFVARSDARRREGDRLRALRTAYANDPQIGPAGYTPAMAAIAAAALLEDLRDRSTAGRFRRIDVLTGAVLESRVIALHDCPRCRPQPANYEPTRRFVEALVPELEKIAL